MSFSFPRLRPSRSGCRPGIANRGGNSTRQKETHYFGRGSALGVGRAHPVGHAAVGQRIDAELAEHVDALGPVVHAVRGNMRDHAGAAKDKFLAIAFSGDGLIERMFPGNGSKSCRRFVEERLQFGDSPG